MLLVHEIYASIQGESTHAGRPCVFVRLSACDLRCTWCDTTYAFTGGTKMSIDEVVSAVDGYGCPLVEITGGEPLLQDEVYPLMERLLERGKTVMLETGGHRPIDRDACGWDIERGDQRRLDHDAGGEDVGGDRVDAGDDSRAARAGRAGAGIEQVVGDRLVAEEPLPLLRR